MQKSYLGPYKIMAEIAKGGMGKIYKAQHPKLDRMVAIKMMLEDNVSSEEKNRFMVEAQTLAKLKHPNIVPIYDINTIDNMTYIVMDFIEGITLAERIKKSSLTPHQALKIMLPIIQAMEYAHGQG